MRSKGYGTRSVCLCVYAYFHTTGSEADGERYQRLQCYKRSKNKMAILLKRLCKNTMEKTRKEKKPT